MPATCWARFSMTGSGCGDALASGRFLRALMLQFFGPSIGRRWYLHRGSHRGRRKKVRVAMKLRLCRSAARSLTVLLLSLRRGAC